MVKETLSVVCVGSNIESKVVLERFIENGITVRALVTLPPQYSAGVTDYVDLHSFCLDHQIQTIDAQDINNPSVVAVIRDYQPDYIFVLGWSQLLKTAVLDLPKGYVVGSHPTPLPERRGRAPIPWTILEGHDRSAVTLFKMGHGADDGAILAQRAFDVPDGSYAIELYLRSANELAAAFVSLYTSLVNKEIESEPQNQELASYRSVRRPADGHIDFHRDAQSIVRLIRAVSEPYPGAYTYWRGEKIVVWRADVYTGVERKGVPGQVLANHSGRVAVQASDRPVSLWMCNGYSGDLPASYFKLGLTFGFRVEDTLDELQRRLSVLEKQMANTYD